MRIAIGIVLATVALATSCNKNAAQQPPTTTSGEVAPPSSATSAAADQEQAISEVRTYYRRHHASIGTFLRLSIDTLGVSPDKKAKLEKIQQDLRDAGAPARDARKEVLSTLADGIAANAIDYGRVDDAVAKLKEAAAPRHDAAVNALDALHATLAPEERMALADKVEAHAAVWEEVNAEDLAKPKTGRLERLAGELSLTPDQVSKISAALSANAPPKADPSAVKAYMNAFVEEFPKPNFDAKAFMDETAADRAMAAGEPRVVWFYETITPYLTPDQRQKLAADMRARIEEGRPTGGQP
jgi:Spy/CpxP family protein refolding chaperone